MTRAYNEMYLDDAMRNLGEAVDYAANCCNINPDTFMEMFLKSSFSRQFETGVPRVVSGMSGTEMVLEIAWQAGITAELPEPQTEYGYSMEYWCGWILAYYQWYSGYRFQDIISSLPMREIAGLYPALHESPEEKFAETASRRMRSQQ